MCFNGLEHTSYEVQALRAKARSDALTSIVANLHVYSEQTKEAKKLGAKIIVFPEVIAQS